MSNDGFRRVLFNAGEQAVVADLNDLQKFLHMHLIDMFVMPRLTNMAQDPSDTETLLPTHSEFALGKLATAVPRDVAFCPFPACGYVVPGAGARQLVVGAPGPVVQVLGTDLQDPSLASTLVLPYWMDVNEFTLTTAVGDATNPRVDVVEMRLQQVDDDLVARVFAQGAVKASLDLVTASATCETVIQARVEGVGGNNISLVFVNDGAGTGTLTQNGNALTFHYASGVTTVANFEALVATSTLIEINTADPSPGDVLTHPGDTFTTSFLEGGVDRLVQSLSVNKARRVSATFQIKQGTPAATPAFPTLTAGFVPIAAVYVPALQNAVHSIGRIRDLRWPLGGVRAYDVDPFMMNLGAWTLDLTKHCATSPAAGQSLIVPCPVGGDMGRLVGVGILGAFGGTAAGTLKIGRWVGTGGAFTFTPMADMTSVWLASLKTLGLFLVGSSTMIADGSVTDTDGIFPSETATRPSTARTGMPIWTNGRRSGPAFRHAYRANQDTVSGQILQERIAVEAAITPAGSLLQMIRFYVAHGLG